MTEPNSGPDLQDDQSGCWHTGEYVRVEDYLERYPELRDDVEAVVDLINNELRLRLELQPAQQLDYLRQDYLRRFPLYEERLRLQFEFDYVVLPALESNAALSGASTPRPLDTSGERQDGEDPAFPAGYERGEKLGEGGMGVVYRARQRELNRAVALKMIRSGALAGEEELARFRTEAKAVARLQHPNIVQVFDADQHDGQPFIVLELIEGGSLEGKLSSNSMEPKAAATLTRSLALALEHAHDHGIIHRDLKPRNVLLAQDDTPKVTDFGLARMLDEEGSTTTNAVLGTPSYMAPEQARGQRDVGRLADVWALGATLYACLTGRPPFKGADRAETLRQVIELDPVPLRSVVPSVPRDLETICLKCLRKDPAQRYRSAKELAEDLDRYLQGRPILARPVGRLERVRKWVGRNRAVAGAVAVAVAALIVGAGFSAGFGIDAWFSAKQARKEWKRAETEAERAEARAHSKKVLLAQVLMGEGKLLEGAAELDGCDPDARGWEWRLLRRLGAVETLAVGDITRPALCVAHSPDGKALVSGHGDMLRVWDAVSGQELLAFQAHRGGVSCLSISPDGSLIATGGRDEDAVRIWDARSGRPVRSLPGHPRGVSSVEFSPDGTRLASTGSGGLIVWELRSGRALALKDATGGKQGGGKVAVWTSNRGHGTFQRARFSPDGKRVAAAGADSTVRLWELHSGEVVLTHQGHLASVHDVCFSPEGEQLASAGGDNTVRVWDTRTGRDSLVYRGHRTHLDCVRYSPDGRWLASSGGTMVRVWDVRSGQDVLVLEQAHAESVTGLSFSPDSSRLASSSADGTVSVWDLRLTGEAVVLEAARGSASCVAFRPGEDAQLAVRDSGSVRIVDCRTGQEVLRLKGATDRGVAFRCDGRRLASGGNRMVRVWDLKDGRELPALQGLESRIYAVAYSPDGRRLAAGDRGKVVIWDADSGERAHTLPGHDDIVWGLAFSTDGKRLASAGADRTVRVWEVESGRAVCKLEGHADWVHGVSFSPDGGRLASASRDGTVRIWDLERGKEEFVLTEHREWVRSVVYSPDGKRLASAGDDGKVRLWDTGSGEQVLALAGASQSVAFCPEGRWLAAGAGNGEVRVWEAQAGAGPLVLKGLRGVVEGVGFSADGRRVVAGCRLARGGAGEVSATIGPRKRAEEVCAWDARTGQPVTPCTDPRPASARRATSPDGGLVAEARGRKVLLHRAVDRTVEALQRRETADRWATGVWHQQRAAECEQHGEWFPALFHLDRLIAAQPADASLSDRRARVISRAAGRNPSR